MVGDLIKHHLRNAIMDYINGHTFLYIDQLFEQIDSMDIILASVQVPLNLFIHTFSKTLSLYLKAFYIAVIISMESTELSE